MVGFAIEFDGEILLSAEIIISSDDICGKGSDKGVFVEIGAPITYNIYAMSYLTQFVQCLTPPKVRSMHSHDTTDHRTRLFQIGFDLQI